MPMMKTVSVGRASVSEIKEYLMGGKRQEQASLAEEMALFESGAVQLSERHAETLRSYLTGGSRALAVDVSDDLSVRGWAEQMNITHALFDRGIRLADGKKTRAYYHYILSPDPNDACTLSTLRAYAREWAEENFRRNGECHEYAIVYHDDNVKGVLHAHIVVNATDRKTGKKLQVSNDRVVGLQISAQEIGKRYGLTPIREKMQRTIGARTRVPVYLDRKEREILNKGGYSWKWELRKAISDIAPLSNDFEDFRSKLNRAGYDVTSSDKTGYLTYTHRNGIRVKDSKLGAKFYLDSLERVFSREYVLNDKTYASWELMKISKGEIPWKEDIRRAIDAVAPTVLSIPELERELRERYSIRLIVNRRGITYQHSAGFKARDVSIGFRYTFEGLRQNAVVGMALPYPGYQAVVRESSFLVKHYMPRSFQGIGQAATEQAATHFIYRDMTDLMMRYGLTRIDDIATAIEGRYRELREEKAEITSLRSEVMRWNHFSTLLTRFEKDGRFLCEEGQEADPSLYNDALIRYERIGLYLKQQVGGQDIRGVHKRLSEAYEQRLGSYQERLGELNRDMTVYQNYLMGHDVRSGLGIGEEGSVDVQGLFAAGRTLARYHVRDFFHLEQTISMQENRLDLVQFKLNRAQRNRRELDGIQEDIRTYIEAKAYLPSGGPLAEHPDALGLSVQKLRFDEAERRLSSLGISEADFGAQHEAYQKAVRECSELEKELSQLKNVVSELTSARDVCLAVAKQAKTPIERERAQAGKPSSAAGSDVMAGIVERADAKDEAELLNEAKEASMKDLPIEEARKRRRERMREAPERSRRQRDELVR